MKKIVLSSFKNDQKYWLITIILGFFLRLYYSNLESYWFDEQISFFIAKPNLTFNEFYKIHYSTDRSPFLYNFILKNWFSIIEYNPSVGRYLSLIINFLTIFIFIFSSLSFYKRNTFLIIFFSSLNIYLINYSAETRPYALVLFFSLIQITYFNILFIEEAFKKKNILGFIILSIIILLSHIFTSIILASEFFFLIINAIIQKDKKIYKKFIIFLTIFLIYVFIQYDYIVSLIYYSPPDWFIHNTDWTFYFNLYFSRFFGSKTMGLIFYLIFFYLIISNLNKIFKNKKYLFLLILFVCSYLIPLLYELISKPILLDRYIIFVIIPIFLLISFLVEDLKNKSLKKFLIILIIISTLVNQFFEIYNANPQKPDFKSALEYLHKYRVKQIAVIVNEDGIVDIEEKDKLKDKKIVENYILNFDNYKNYFHLIDLNQPTLLEKNIWLLCYEPLAGYNCNKNIKTERSFTILNKIAFHKIQLLKLQFN